MKVILYWILAIIITLGAIVYQRATGLTYDKKTGMNIDNQYIIGLEKNGTEFPLNNNEPVIIRFKGDAPATILLPHIILMFVAMFLSNPAGIMALFKRAQHLWFAARSGNR